MMALPMPEVCAERIALSQRVRDALDDVFRAKSSYDDALLGKAANASALRQVLAAAISAERAAVDALYEHVREHRCSGQRPA